MRPSLLALALATSLVTACAHAPAEAPAPITAGSTETPATTPDAAFASLSRQWLDGMLALSPVSATSIGDHRFDGELDDLSPAGMAKGAAFSRDMLARLDAIDIAALGRENQVDALILRNQLQADIWYTETLQSWAWDPQVYNGVAGGAIYGLMAREFAPMPERLKSATMRMEKLPALYAQMRANLDPARVPRIHAETVSKQNGGVLALIDQFITPNAGQLKGADRQRLDAAIAGVRAAVAENQQWLDKTLVPNAKGDFRLGAALYDQKLKFSLNSALSRGEIKQRAEAELKRARGEMYGIARQVLKGKRGAPALPASPTPAQQQKAIEAALELAYAERPARDQVVPFAKQTLAMATDFVRKHDLVTVPADIADLTCDMRDPGQTTRYSQRMALASLVTAGAVLPGEVVTYEAAGFSKATSIRLAEAYAAAEQRKAQQAMAQQALAARVDPIASALVAQREDGVEL